MRRCVSFLATATIFLILPPQPVGSQEPVTIGDQGQVNTYTTNDQMSPAVGVDNEGNFVVVWQSDGSGGSDSDWYSIQGRIFFSNGFPAGPEDQVNTSTESLQSESAVAVDADGNFVVVWTTFEPYGEELGIRAQRYGSDGLQAGGEFRVNTYGIDYQYFPAVAMDTDGDFVVVWASYGSSHDDNSYASIQGQRFDSDGDPAGGEFQVNVYTTGYQTAPAVGMNADGNFVVVWQSDGSGGGDIDGRSIQGRIFSSTGAPITPQAQVNNYSTGNQENPAVGVDGEGNFVVVWTSFGSNGDDDSYSSIQGRIYSSNGAPIGLQAQVNTYTSNSQTSPAVAVDDDGNFVVVWSSNGSNGSDTGKSIQGQLYGSDGLPAGGEFQVNTYTTGTQEHPAIEFDARGRFVVVWTSTESSGSDDSAMSIQGQRFAVPLFADGFESGDTSGWSTSIP